MNLGGLLQNSMRVNAKHLEENGHHLAWISFSLISTKQQYSMNTSNQEIQRRKVITKIQKTITVLRKK